MELERGADPRGLGGEVVVVRRSERRWLRRCSVYNVNHRETRKSEGDPTSWVNSTNS